MQTKQALDEASEWFVKLSSGEIKEQDLLAFQKWQQANTLNIQAWQKIQHVTQHFKTAASYQEVNQTLQHFYHSPLKQRRLALKQIAIAMATVGLSYSAYRTQPWQPLMADYRTPTGGQQRVTLADGSLLILNTATSVNITFTDSERLIELIAGEVLIETAQEQSRPYRPLLVSTQHGKATALGTRFSVRDFDRHTQVSVLEGAVRISPNNASTSTTIQAGESITFNANQLMQKTAFDTTNTAWSKGFLVVDDMRMEDFIQALSRYRSGLLQCDSTVANISISGSFPIHDTDKTLQIMTERFPVKVETYTKFLTILRASTAREF